MGWEIGYDSNWHRDIGYGVPAYCDEPGCDKEIDRGLSYVCGGDGCGLYFCKDHGGGGLCARCADPDGASFYPPKPEHPKWLRHKLTDPSWDEWRLNNPRVVAWYEYLLREKEGS